jgi:hypothetical protein
MSDDLTALGPNAFAAAKFLAVGVAADLAALVLPSTAAGLWQAGQRATALVGWVVWLVTFVFAMTAGIGFAATNISDVTLVRASRVTPAVTSAQAAVCTENLSSGVVMVKSTEDGVRFDASDSLNFASDRGILVQGPMRSDAIIIVGVGF